MVRAVLERITRRPLPPLGPRALTARLPRPLPASKVPPRSRSRPRRLRTVSLVSKRFRALCLSMLRALYLDFTRFTDPLTIDVPLQQFTALSRLSLNFYSDDIARFPPGCCLPKSLTYLNLDSLDEGMPTSQASWRARQRH